MASTKAPTHDPHYVDRGDHVVQRGIEEAELESVLPGALAHGVFVGEAGGGDGSKIA